MSVGNLIDNGNKGRNMPYQLSVLQLLSAILAASGGGSLPVVRTPTLVRVTTAGSVAAGARGVTIANVGGAPGTVLGTSVTAGQVISFDAGSTADTLAVIAYDATGTEFLISKVV